MSLMMRMAALARVSKTYATWNPSDKATNVVLTNGNLTCATTSSFSSSFVRATIGKSAGKWYWETTGFGVSGGYEQCIGVAKSTAQLDSYVGGDANGFGFASWGCKYTSGAAVGWGATYGTTDVVGYALDMDAGTIKVYKNGASLGVMYSGLSGTFYPAASTGNYYPVTICTANFGATAFSYTPPAGYNAGLF